MVQAFAIVAIVFILVFGWAIWQSQNKRPNPYTDISGSMPKPVVIIDVEMPFASMVLFMVKLVLAAIPAALIATFLFMLTSALLFNLGLSLGMPSRF